MIDDGPLISSGKPEWSGWAVLAVFLFPATGGLLFGYDIGATSYVLNQVLVHRTVTTPRTC